MSLPNKPISGLGKRELESSRAESGRPSKKPDRDFRKVVERRDERESSGKKSENVADEPENSDSIFDLASSKGTVEKEGADSPLNLLAKAATQGDKAFGADASGELTGLMTNKSDTEDSAKKGSSFGQNRENLSFVNPHAQSNIHTAALNAEATVTPISKVAELQKLVDQIEPTLYTVKQDGVTDTAVKIQHPPVFAGSELVVRAFDSAKGEFNISFNNLTQEAKALLDNHQAALMKGLEERGYVAHIMVTSTQPYEKIVTDTSNVQTGQQHARGEDEGQGREEDSQGGQDRQG